MNLDDPAPERETSDTASASPDWKDLYLRCAGHRNALLIEINSLQAYRKLLDQDLTDAKQAFEETAAELERIRNKLSDLTLRLESALHAVQLEQAKVAVLERRLTQRVIRALRRLLSVSSSQDAVRRAG